MKRFRFPLARVHGLRSQQERIARRALGAALSEQARLERALQQLRADLDVCRDEESGAAGALASALAAGLRRREFALLRRVVEAQQATEIARENYRVRRTELRGLDRLRDARREEWRQECAREEQAELEELVRIRAGMQRREAVS